jgi:hypothetical protein
VFEDARGVDEQIIPLAAVPDDLLGIVRHTALKTEEWLVLQQFREVFRGSKRLHCQPIRQRGILAQFLLLLLLPRRLIFVSFFFFHVLSLVLQFEFREEQSGEGSSLLRRHTSLLGGFLQQCTLLRMSCPPVGHLATKEK